MRATIKRHDARVMDHFGQNHRVTRSLRDSIVIVVADWKYRRPRTCPPKTPLVDRAGYSGPSRPCSLRISARSAINFWAASVNGGIRPSGGSMINELRRVDTAFVP